jgi:predicted DNA-binding transcriptional regulator YafY
MSRKDRLYTLAQKMRDGELRTAEALAQDLGVSVRTIYRDMQTLAASGIPVEGARGHGYTVQDTITLPQLNITDDELEALHLALAILGQSDMDQAAGAQSLARKIDALLPEDAGPTPAPFGLATGAYADSARGFAFMPAIRAAIRARQKLRITLSEQTHDLRPLAIDYFGRVWTCVGWSETANDFLSFRIDRTRDLRPLPGLFVEEAGKTLADFRAKQNK